VDGNTRTTRTENQSGRGSEEEDILIIIIIIIIILRRCFPCIHFSVMIGRTTETVSLYFIRILFSYSS
jgi:hypothetical protein